MDFHNKLEERTVPEYWWSDNPEATDKQYDIMQLNVTLFKYTNEILGV